MVQVFIDGEAGTTGLRIYERLGKREDVKILSLPASERKDGAARREAMNASDVVFLCLPDEAAKEAATFVENPNTVVIDASTAHRTQAGWAYGFPELSPAHRKAVQTGKRIANPGCYASGFIALVRPLIENGIADKDYPFVCHAVSGYSGGGKKAIAEYESAEKDEALLSPRLYALGLTHKHLPEMIQQCSLTRKPIFNPYICNFYCGMSVSVPLFLPLLKMRVSLKELLSLFLETYAGSRFLTVKEGEGGYLAANTLRGTNCMELYVNGNEEQALLTACFDNLGKGASGAAIQNMNVALGLDEGLGL